jgi:hypothetical protein
VRKGSSLRLHADIAGSLSATESTLANAIRYDPYGQTITTASGGGSAVGADAWKDRAASMSARLAHGTMDRPLTGSRTRPVLQGITARSHRPRTGHIVV